MIDIYLDTANYGELEAGYKTGIIKGITTNPTILKKEKVSRQETLKKLVKLNPELLFVQVVGDTFEERKDDFYRLVDFFKDQDVAFGPKVPIDMVGLELIAYIVKNHPDLEILGTAIYSADQANIAALAGCHHLAPYYNRMLNENIDAYDQVAKMREFIDEHDLNTKILCASFKNAAQVWEAIEAGAHSVTVGFDIYENMINKRLALAAIDVFNRDGHEA